MPPRRSLACCPIIEEEIDEEKMPQEYAVAKYGFKCLMMNYVTFFVNLLAMGCYAAAGDNNGNKFENCGLAIAFIVFGVPVSRYDWAICV